MVDVHSVIHQLDHSNPSKNIFLFYKCPTIAFCDGGTFWSVRTKSLSCQSSLYDPLS